MALLEAPDVFFRSLPWFFLLGLGFQCSSWAQVCLRVFFRLRGLAKKGLSSLSVLWLHIKAFKNKADNAEKNLAANPKAEIPQALSWNLVELGSVFATSLSCETSALRGVLARFGAVWGSFLVLP